MSRYKNNNINGGYLFELFKEPMLVLLIAAATLFYSGQNNEAYFMLAAIVAVSGISLPGQPQPKSNK
jgi:hypothetical protein